MPRIVFNSNTIDISIDSRSLQPIHEHDFKQNESGSGKIEQVNIFGRDKVQFFATLTETTERKMHAWWAWARQGKPFKFAMNSARMSSVSVVTATAGAKTVFLASTTGLNVGDVCLLRAEDNDDEFEYVKIASKKSGVSIAGEDNLIYSYNYGDTFRHRDYWPSAVNLAKKFDPDKQGPIYLYTFEFTEQL